MQIGNYVSTQHKGTVALMSYQTMLILHGKLVITWYVIFFQGIYQFVIIYLTSVYFLAFPGLSSLKVNVLN